MYQAVTPRILPSFSQATEAKSIVGSMRGGSNTYKKGQNFFILSIEVCQVLTPLFFFNRLFFDAVQKTIYRALVQKKRAVDNAKQRKDVWFCHLPHKCSSGKGRLKHILLFFCFWWLFVVGCSNAPPLPSSPHPMQFRAMLNESMKEWRGKKKKSFGSATELHRKKKKISEIEEGSTKTAFLLGGPVFKKHVTETGNEAERDTHINICKRENGEERKHKQYTYCRRFEGNTAADWKAGGLYRCIKTKQKKNKPWCPNKKKGNKEQNWKRELKIKSKKRNAWKAALMTCLSVSSLKDSHSQVYMRVECQQSAFSSSIHANHVPKKEMLIM